MASLFCRPFSLFLKPRLPNIPILPNHYEPSNKIRHQVFSLSTRSENPEEIAHQFRFFSVYKDGRIQKFRETHRIPPFDDPVTGVRSQDLVVSTQPSIYARIFLPRVPEPTRKLPLLFYIHGGGFCFESAFSPKIHNYVSTLAARAEAIAVSVEYRLAPEHPIPACYDDSWEAFKWVAAHSSGNGPSAWLNKRADFNRVFIGGDSAGGNISHDIAVRFGLDQFSGINLIGAVLIHPYFGGTEDDAMWLYMCPENRGLEDPRLRPGPVEMARFGCERVLVFVAGKDHLKGVGKWYVEGLKRSEWRGEVELVENYGEEHCFHINDLSYDKARELVDRFASFVNRK